MRGPAVAVAVLVVVVVVPWAGCADLPDLGAGSCGNGVVESGEDCDGVVDPSLGSGTTCGAAASGPGACHYTCVPPAQHGCPSGWGCAVDGVCRHAAGIGALQAPSGAPWPLPSRTLAFGDVDGDRHPDAIGYGGTTLTVRFGSGDGRFNASASFGTGFGTSVPAFRDLPLASGSTAPVDAILPLASGLYGLHVLGDRSIFPLAYPASDEARPPVSERMLSVRLHPGDAGDALVHLVGAQALVFDEEDLVDGPALFAFPDGADTAALAGDVPVGDVDGPVGAVAGGQSIALPFAGATSVWIYAAAPTGGGAMLRQVVELPAPVDLGARFADVDGDGRLDLMVSVRVAADAYVAVARNAGDGSFGPALRDDRFAQLIEAGCGTSPWPLAAGDLDGDGVADYVGDRGVCLTRGANLVKTGDLPGDRPGAWSAAVIADLNHDGAGDVAATSDGAIGIDLLTGDPAGRGLFNYARLPTPAPPRLLTAGDFDGDFIADLAFVSAGSRPGAAGEEVAVVFGAVDGRPAAATTMGAFPRVALLARTMVTLSPAPRDLTDDLIVLAVEPSREGDPPGDERRSLTFLIGDPQRIMSATAPLRVGPDLFDKPGAVALGDLDSDGFVDAVVLATRPDDGQSLWVLHGGPSGRFRDASRHVVDGVLPLPCARLLTRKLGADGRPHILGFTADHCDGSAGSPTPTFVDISFSQGGVPIIDAVPVPGGLTVPTSAILTDLDGDGAPDLLVAFAGEWAAPPDSGAVPGAGVAIYFDRDGTIDPAADGNFVLGGFPSRVSPFAAAPAQLDADAEPELAIVTSGGLYLAERQPTGFAFVGDPLTGAAVSTPASRLYVADLNGDGLDDLVFDGDDVLHVYLSTGVNAADEQPIVP